MSKAVELHITSEPEMLRVLRAAAAQIALLAGFSSLETSKIVLAVDEACSNIIRHAYENEKGKPIDVSFILDQSYLTIKLCDYGKCIDLQHIKARNLDEVRPGGLGLYLISSVMDSLEFQRSDEGNITIMKKKLQTKE